MASTGHAVAALPGEASETLSGRVFQALREAIVAGELAAGRRSLSRSWRVSTGFAAVLCASQ
jgi:DNA-binding GntR family transcriptional regulator